MAYRQTVRVLRHKEATREAILQAATALVGAGEPVSMEAVARGAGVSVGSLYTYFADRGALLAALFAFRAEKELAVMEEALESDPDPERSLEHAVTTMLRRMRRNPGLALFLLLERMDRDERLEAMKLDFHRRHCAAISGCIGRGMRLGVFPDQLPEISAAAILGAVIEVATRSLAVPRGAEVPVASLEWYPEVVVERQLARTVLAICGRQHTVRRWGHS